MDNFLKEISEGELHHRDKLQFELKSNFTPSPLLDDNTYSQEFYIFTPKVLQINKESYSQEDFYLDQTNFIRYKTPKFTLVELIDKDNKKSPLYRLRSILRLVPSKENIDIAIDELKLYGNIVRSALRKTARKHIEDLTKLKSDQENQEWNDEIKSLQSDLHILRINYEKIENNFLSADSEWTIKKYFEYVDEFISVSTDYYATVMLSSLRSSKIKGLESGEKMLCQLIHKEKKLREEKHNEPKKMHSEGTDSEFLLYRRGLLNKFVLDALLLNVTRKKTAKMYTQITASLAAAVAMLFYLILFIWQGEIFVINSTPFVILTVILYVIKDRIKDGIKLLYQKRAFQWFPDFTTEIFDWEDTSPMGRLSESFSFISEKFLPKEIVKIRNKQFHDMLETFKRPESVLYYKKEIFLYPGRARRLSRRFELNNIFRFNIHKFITKASDAYSHQTILEKSNDELISKAFPKVYHINVIMVNSYTDSNFKPQREVKKFRLIINKEGIQRIEHVRHHSN